VVVVVVLRARGTEVWVVAAIFHGPVRVTNFEKNLREPHLLKLPPYWARL
jgi:hypothetical protein